MSALLKVILLLPPPRPATHSSPHKIAKGLRRCCFATLTFLTRVHMPSVMLCIHHPTIHTSEANSLLAAPSFISWVLVLISCYAALQEQEQELPPSLHKWEARSRAQDAGCKTQLKRRRTTQAAYPELYPTEGQQKQRKLNAERRGTQWGECRTSVDACGEKGERELHHEGQDFTLVFSRSSTSNGAEATAKEPQKVARPSVGKYAVFYSWLKVYV